jgi:hypothetical protein
MKIVTGKSRNGLTQQSTLSVTFLMIASSLLLLINMIVVARFDSFIAFLAALVGTAFLIKQKEVIQLVSWIQRRGRQYKLNIALLVFCLVGVVYFLDLSAAPASAQFFNQTEGWLRSSFPATASAGGVDIYNLVFNTLRAIFVLYLAISLVRVIAAARNDEDWQTLARTPLIILITVTLGDILASLITGGGGGAA